MSIVEKAITKLQEAGRAVSERRPVAEAPAVAPAVTLDAKDRASEAVPQISRPIVANSKIEIDMAALQRNGLLTPKDDAAAVRNQFRRLKWPVLDELANRRRERQELAGVVMVASAMPGEGKTFTSCNLALSMAREEDRCVILVDADIAKSYLTEAFGLRDRPGLTEYLANPALDIADVLVATNNSRLFILPAGKFVPHVSELFSGARMQQLLRELTETGPNTIVLIDSSPVLATNEAQVLARLVPQILVVIRAEHTPQPVVLEACDLLGREKLSAVLNQAHGASAGEAYGAAYGSYGNE